MKELIHIKRLIHNIRGKQVIIDSDLAELYEVETRRLNEQVKRNKERFPEDFMFQLTKEEIKNLRSQIAMSSDKVKKVPKEKVSDDSQHGGRRYVPYVFTEQGVAMLSGVLRSKKAIEVNIQIMRAFVEMRKFIHKNAQLFQKIGTIEEKLLDHDNKIEQIFSIIEQKEILPEKGIFFEGQVFEAYKFVSDLIRKAKTSIILVDNYIDDSVLTLFRKRKKAVEVTIYTKNITKQLKLDIKKFNSQYEKIKVKEFRKSHDRFLIIDEKDVYHIGASLKDLGKKWFAFSKFDKDALNIVEKISK
ncbi:MAG: hypothetical protein MAG795_00474 [Candidatus Woesearchaeota archaeon]|nr:hypothetical protein [Candidatus Woesearchaeota archaeon]